jgi:hypothetical protein
MSSDTAFNETIASFIVASVYPYDRCKARILKIFFPPFDSLLLNKNLNFPESEIFSCIP